MSLFEWFYALPLVNADWSSSEAGALLRAAAASRRGKAGIVERLEEAVRKETGASEAIAFERGRSALKWILEWAAARPEARGRRAVILPSLLCRAVPDAVLAAGLEPVLCDVTGDLAMDPRSAEEVFDPDRTLALLVPHIYGQPSSPEAFKAMARPSSAVIIDDAAAALGGRLNRIPLGLHGDAGIYSFSQGKAAVGGEGGVLVLPEDGPFRGGSDERPEIQSPSLSRAFTHFRRFAWDVLLHRFSEPLGRIASIGAARLRLGPFLGKALKIENRSMTWLAAAPALAQMERIAAMARQRRENMLGLEEDLSDLPGLRVLPVPGETTPVRFAVETLDLKVVRDEAGIREENPLARHLRKAGIEARYAYLPLHEYKDLRAFPSSGVENSRRLGERLLLLPSFSNLKRGDMARISRAVRSFLGR